MLCKKVVGVVNRYNELSLQLKATLWFFVCSFFQKGISTITTPIFTRILTTQEFGKYSIFNSWLSILQVVLTLNIANGIYTQGLVKYEQERKPYASSMQGLNLTLCIVWSVVYFFFKDCINNILGLTTLQCCAMLCMIWASTAFSLWSIVQRVKYNYISLVIITLLVSVTKPLLSIIFIYIMDDNVTARILGIVLIEIIGYSIVCIKQLVEGGCYFKKKFWKYALCLNIPLVPHALSQTILNSADRIMIERIVSEEAAGIYSLAYSISLVMTLFNVALGQAFAPWTYQKIRDGKVNDISGIAYVSMIFIAIINFLVILLAPEIVALFAPSTYADAKYIIPPVAMSAFFVFLYDWFVRFEYYYEKSIWIMSASVAGAVLNIILNQIFITKLGYIAAGYTTLFCYILYTFLHFYYMRKICKKELGGSVVFNGKKIFVISIGLMLSGFFVLLTYANIVLRYLMIGLIMFVAIVLREKIKNEIQQVFKILRSY